MSCLKLPMVKINSGVRLVCGNNIPGQVVMTKAAKPSVDCSGSETGKTGSQVDGPESTAGHKHRKGPSGVLRTTGLQSIGVPNARSGLVEGIRR